MLRSPLESFAGRCRRILLPLFRLVVIALMMSVIIAPVMAEEPAPQKLSLIKLEYPGKPRYIRMVYLPLMGVGDQATDQPLLLDTG